jgi:hypothetical protein
MWVKRKSIGGPGDFETAGQNARHGVQIWRSGAVQLQIEEIIAPAVACLCYEALSEWHSGKVTSCHATMEKALSLAKDHPGLSKGERVVPESCRPRQPRRHE